MFCEDNGGGLLYYFTRTARTKYVSGWLKATQIYSLTIVEAGGVEPRHRQGCAPSEGSRGEPDVWLSYSFSCLQAIFGIPWLVDTPLPSLSLPLHGVLSLCDNVSLSNLPLFLLFFFK